LLKFLVKSIEIVLVLFGLTGQLVEHDNAYVRSSAAVAFVEAVERWPVSITETTDALLSLYREKVARDASLRKEKADSRAGKDFSPGI
jgi:hypothetical protein